MGQASKIGIKTWDIFITLMGTWGFQLKHVFPLKIPYSLKGFGQ